MLVTSLDPRRVFLGTALAPHLLPMPGMDGGRVRSWIGSSLVLLAGCAHHVVGRPPAANEIEEINRAGSDGDGPAAMILNVAQPQRESWASSAAAPVRPIVDVGAPEIRQIVAADATKLMVIDRAGAARSVDLSSLDGVTTVNHRRAMLRNAGGGALGGLIAGGLVVLCLQLGRRLPDMSPTRERSSLLAPEIDAVATATLAGALLGLLSAYRNPEEAFQFAPR